MDVRKNTPSTARDLSLFYVSQRIAALDKFKKATKLKIKLQTHRMDWFQEAEHLSNLASKTEDGIGELLQAVVVASPHEGKAYIWRCKF